MAHEYRKRKTGNGIKNWINGKMEKATKRGECITECGKTDEMQIPVVTHLKKMQHAEYLKGKYKYTATPSLLFPLTSNH